MCMMKDYGYLLLKLGRTLADPPRILQVWFNRLIFNCFGTKIHIRYKPEKVGLQYTEVDDDSC